MQPKWRSSVSIPRKHVSNSGSGWAGRYSLGSAIGLSHHACHWPKKIFLAMFGWAPSDGPCTFYRLLFERNMPVPHGTANHLVQTTSSAPQTVAVLPYEQYLTRFPAYLQQLTMESNGKHVNRHWNRKSRNQLARSIGGEPGTNGQHSFYQLLSSGEQGLSLATLSCSANLSIRSDGNHDILVGNAFAQAEALAFGKTEGGGQSRGYTRLVWYRNHVLRRQPAVKT